MHMIISVADRDPTTPIHITTPGDPRPIHQILNHLRPLLITEHRILRRTPQRAMPHRPCFGRLSPFAGGVNDTPAATAGSLNSATNPATSNDPSARRPG
nr:hypothetical protein [Pseudonocardia sp. ICBG601]